MKSKLTTQHKWIIALLAFVLVNAAVWVWGLSPAIERVNALRDDLVKVEDRQKRLQQQLAELQAIEDIPLTEQLEAVNLRVPGSNMLREFIHGFVDYADEMEMPLPSLTIGAPAAADPYFSVTLSTTITGSYEKIKAFLIGLEEHERLILVRTYSFNGKAELLNCSLSLTIFAEEYDQLTPYEAPGRGNPFKED